MSEETPLEPITPEPVTEPTEAVPTEPVLTATPPAPPSWPTPPPSGSDGSGRSGSVAVPKWLLLVVGALVIAVLGFVVGWIAAPAGGSDHRAVSPDPRVVPGPFANGGGSATRPANPVPGPQRLRGAFLGVVTSESTNPAGARIVRVIAAGPAARGGLQDGDVITRVDSDAVTNPTELATRIRAHQRGDKVTITYVRGGTTHTASVTLARRTTFEPPTSSTSRPQF